MSLHYPNLVLHLLYWMQSLHGSNKMSFIGDLNAMLLFIFTRVLPSIYLKKKYCISSSVLQIFIIIIKRERETSSDHVLK